MEANNYISKKILRIQPVFLILTVAFASMLGAQESIQQPPATKNVVIELFYRSDSPQSINAQKYLAQLEQKRPGIEIKTYDVLQDKQQLKRLWEVSKSHGLEKAGLPTFFFCDRLKVGFRDPQTSGVQIEDLLTIRAYIRPGCQHCIAGKAFLDEMVLRWPAIKIQYFDVISDYRARADVQKLAAKYRVQVASFPCIEVAGRLVVGFQTAETTGNNIESLFQDRSVTFSSEESSPKGDGKIKDQAGEKEAIKKAAVNVVPLSGVTALSGNRRAPQDSGSRSVNRLAAFLPVALLQVTRQDDNRAPRESTQQQDPAETPLPQEPPLPDDVPMPADVTMPAEGEFSDDIGEDTVIFGVGSADGNVDEIDVPVFGRLSVSKIGLPAFTFLIGLVDGFNPCAMWVLVFLLSVLVNLKERKKIILVAGTFVVVSGLAYFVFIAAWFNVFRLIGLLRPVQIGLGVAAIIVGLINVKDFFAFHKGVTLSIPESAKPGIYRRVRGIVSANHLWAALSAAVVLAVVVNIVELLCTAGLPALYAEVLTMQNLPTATNYAYLGLYICAYMLDDTILVVIVVTTLSNRRLQESEGRWLKLMSGVVILSLGAVMIFKPNWLV